MKGQIQGFYYLVVLQVILIGMFTLYSYEVSTVNCPDIFGVQQSRTFNQTNQNVTQANYFGWVTVLTGSCSGIPMWVWLVMFLPAILSIIIYVLPNWIAGGG